VSDPLLRRAVQRVGIEAVISALNVEQLNFLRYTWEALARPEQLPPDGDWLVWLLLAGRGFGKSRTGAEWCRQQVKDMPGSHGALVAPTAADARDVMAKALLACTPPWEGFQSEAVISYEPSKRLLTWANGTTATLYSAEEPDRLRGPQHHWAWCDEIAAWEYAEDCWDMLAMTLRLGDRPRCVVSTTPRPIAIVRRLMADPGTAITRGSTFDNSANLSASFIEAVRQRYDGTRLGRQELYAEILDDVPGALWQRDVLDRLRVREAPDLVRVVVAVDPSGGAGPENDEQGIMVCGKGVDGHAYVLADKTCRLSPDGWARRAVEAYREHKADRIVYERNFGGDMVEHTIATVARSMGVHVATRAVVASRGKVQRAEPVAALYEQGKAHHVGSLPLLEDEQCRFVPGEFDGSPNRVDALVWAMTDLMLGEPAATFHRTPHHQRRM
jgi:phage terminase large subunit-like protein